MSPPTLAARLAASPGLLAVGLIALIAAVVLSVIGAMMARAGQSLRPLAWFAGLLALVLGPQLAYHAAVAAGVVGELPAWVPADATSPAPLLQATADGGAVAADGGRFLYPARVFGGDVDLDLVRDAHAFFGDVLGAADVAQLAIFATGETALAARFPGRDAARDAARRYLRFFRIEAPLPADVVTVTRPAGDVARLVLADRMLFVWTGADAAVLDRREASVAAVHVGTPPRDAATTAPGAATRPAPADWRLFALVVVLDLVAVVLWFFKGAAWAAGAPPRAGVAPITAAELEGRLLALDAPERPFTVGRAGPGEIEVTWRVADARWIDLARARGVQRVHRLVVRLDETSHAARVREWWSAWDWSTGRGGTDVAWRAGTGITFFERRSETVLGVQLDTRGVPTGDLAATWRFDVEEMKAPLRDVVAAAGWRWRPLVWDAPRWLRWATE